MTTKSPKGTGSPTEMSPEDLDRISGGKLDGGPGDIVIIGDLAGRKPNKTTSNNTDPKGR